MSETKKTLTVKLYGNLGGDTQFCAPPDQVITRPVDGRPLAYDRRNSVGSFSLGDFARIRFTGKGVFAEYMLIHWLKWPAVLRCPDLDSRNQRGSDPNFASTTIRPLRA